MVLVKVRFQWRIALLLCLIVLTLAACSGNKDVPPPPAGAADNPVASPASGTENDSAGNSTPIATTTLPPVITQGPSATATIMPTATPEPVNLYTLADFGEDRNPLTGEVVNDPTVLDRLPIAVKISNAPPQYTRPQSGLNDADLIFEHITEAGITRFTIIIYGKTPPDVGPIRSARLIDLELPAMYDAALAYSGSSDGVRQLLLNADFRPRILFATEKGYYRTGADKPIEHTFYAKPETFWQVLAERGLGERPTFQTSMAFSSEPPAGGQPANEAIIDYDWTLINWRYDPETGRYRRWTDGEEHLDANTGEQVQVSNVVVVLSNHIEDYTICEQIINGVCTAYSVQPQLWGTGPAIIFRDGQRFDGTWERINRYDMLTFKDGSGAPLPLQIGNTWFQVMPVWYESPVTASP